MTDAAAAPTSVDRPARAFDEEPASVAIVRLRVGLGDLLCTVPALRVLRRRLPRAHVALVTWPEMRPVIERMRGLVDELIPFPGYPGIPERPPREAEVAPFFARMRERRFDLALQMYGANPAANAVTERMGAVRTGGFIVPGTWPADLRTHLPYPHHEHESRRHLRLMELLGAPPGDDALAFPVEPADRAAALDLRRRAGLGGAYACLHPGATSPSRRWPPERFAAVGRALVARGLAVAVTGVAGEAAMADEVAAGIGPGAVGVAGRTDLGAFAALLETAAVLVASDTGAAHLAAALRVPSVTVFLSGDPVRWAGADASRHRIARVQVECNPCGHLTCPIDHRCATRLDAAQVVAHAEALLG